MAPHATDILHEGHEQTDGPGERKGAPKWGCPEQFFSGRCPLQEMLAPSQARGAIQSQQRAGTQFVLANGLHGNTGQMQGH